MKVKTTRRCGLWCHRRGWRTSCHGLKFFDNPGLMLFRPDGYIAYSSHTSGCGKHFPMTQPIRSINISLESRGAWLELDRFRAVDHEASERGRDERME